MKRCTMNCGPAMNDKRSEEERQNACEDCEVIHDEGICSTHPDAPHGFNRNASHNAGRYVCDCEGFDPSDNGSEPL